MLTTFIFLCRYLNQSIEEHMKSNPETYDAVVTSEVLEHVSDKHSFLTSCVECLKVIIVVSACIIGEHCLLFG